MKITKAQKIKLYTNMVRVRKLDEAVIEAGVCSLWHSQIGEEAPGAAVCALLNKDDYVFSTHRGMGIGKNLPKGVPAKAILAELYGKATGICGGIVGFHTADAELGVLGLSGTVGGEFTLAAGVGLAAKLRGKKQVVVCFFGDGASGRGTMHTAMLMAANWKLPVVWVCENNLYFGYTPISSAFPRENVADLAFGYNMPGVVVDGQDVMAVYEAADKALKRARAGEGPSLLECKTYRFRVHMEGDQDITPAGPRSQEEIDAWLKRDPIELYRRKLLEQGILTKADIERIDREAAAEMEDAKRFAEEGPMPDPEIIKKLVYAD